jgi:two-component system OmpR family response regulator
MGGNVKVLIVDDEKAIVESVQKGLQPQGWDVHTVLGGREAIEVASRVNFDVVLLDLVMPGMDGVETCRGIKKVSPKTEVLLFSGVAPEVEKFLDAGGVDMILRKPLFFGEVADAIQRLIDRKQGLRKSTGDA